MELDPVSAPGKAAQNPHAILKIQDSAYLGEGQSAQLLGQIGERAAGNGVTRRTLAACSALR